MASPGPISTAEAEERFDEAWIDTMKPLALKKADLEKTIATSTEGERMKWLVWREGRDRWKMIWPFMDAQTKSGLELLGYTVKLTALPVLKPWRRANDRRFDGRN